MPWLAREIALRKNRQITSASSIEKEEKNPLPRFTTRYPGEARGARNHTHGMRFWWEIELKVGSASHRGETAGVSRDEESIYLALVSILSWSEKADEKK